MTDLPLLARFCFPDRSGPSGIFSRMKEVTPPPHDLPRLSLSCQLFLLILFLDPRFKSKTFLWTNGLGTTAPNGVPRASGLSDSQRPPRLRSPQASLAPRHSRADSSIIKYVSGTTFASPLPTDLERVAAFWFLDLNVEGDLKCAHLF